MNTSLDTAARFNMAGMAGGGAKGPGNAGGGQDGMTDRIRQSLGALQKPEGKVAAAAFNLGGNGDNPFGYQAKA